MSRAKYDFLYKILVIGDSGVGKTAIIQRYCENKFDSDYLSTVGVDFKPKMLEVNGKIVKMQIWDTAGQEKFMNITASYYRNTQGVFIVYDVGNRESLERVRMWFAEVSEKTSSNPPAIIIVGNKADGNPPYVVGPEEAKAVVASLGNIRHCQCSAKTGEGIADAFATLLEVIMQKTPGDAKPAAEEVALDGNKSSGCC